jgi:hypothetical protein
MRIRRSLVMASLPLMLLQACASHRPDDEVTAQMARTGAVLQQAERSGAQVGALAEYQAARDKYLQAQRALEKDSEDGDQAAMRLAKQAEVDAQYASAKAQAQRQQNASQEVQQGVRELDNEAQRNATPAPVN